MYSTPHLVVIHSPPPEVGPGGGGYHIYIYIYIYTRPHTYLYIYIYTGIYSCVCESISYPCPPHPWASAEGHLQLVHGADRQRRVPPQSQRHLVAGGTLRGGAVETSEGADHDGILQRFKWLKWVFPMFIIYACIYIHICVDMMLICLCIDIMTSYWYMYI